jgi:MFS family permease
VASGPNSPLLHDPSTLITPSRLPWHAGVTASHRRILFASFLGWTFDGYETYALFLVLPFILQDILTPVQAGSTAVWAGIAISITLLGWGIGGLVGGTLADYIGRKRMMLYSGGRRKLRWSVWFSSRVAVRSTSASGTR